jgi:type IV pilus assembly protein PilW
MKTPNHARGFTLIELMIAVTISAFLMLGILKVMQTTNGTFNAQNQLAQLQDNERLVMAFVSEIIESAGYYPSPQTYAATNVMPAVGPFASNGQALWGTLNGGSPGDTLQVRFGAGLNDNVFGCQGNQNTTVAPYDTFTNVFYLSNGALWCGFNSTGSNPGPAILVTGVTNLRFVYGVKRNPADTGSCTDTYLNGAQMLAADWLAVCSVKMTVTFANPVNPANPITITRVIAVMNAAGVNT